MKGERYCSSLSPSSHLSPLTFWSLPRRHCPARAGTPRSAVLPPAVRLRCRRSACCARRTVRAPATSSRTVAEPDTSLQAGRHGVRLESEGGDLGLKVRADALEILPLVVRSVEHVVRLPELSLPGGTRGKLGGCHRVVVDRGNRKIDEDPANLAGLDVFLLERRHRLEREVATERTLEVRHLVHRHRRTLRSLGPGVNRTARNCPGREPALA